VSETCTTNRRKKTVSFFTFDDVKVSSQCLLEHGVPEETAIGDIAHEELHHHKQLVHGLVKSWCDFGCWCTAYRLLQVGVRRGVVELHGLDSTEKVVVTSVLRVWSGAGEIRFGDQLVGLVVEAVMEVTAEKAVD
jgi:hypothetical protein